MNKYKLLLSKIYRFFKPISEVDKYRRMGVKIGANTKIQFDVIIDFSHHWLIEIGENVTIAPRVHILAHDASTKLHLNYTRIGKVKVENNVFIGAGSIILPGVTIGENSIIAAGSIVTKDLLANKVYAGNPAREIAEMDEYINKRKTEMLNSPVYDESYTLRKNISESKKLQMTKDLENQYGYIE